MILRRLKMIDFIKNIFNPSFRIYAMKPTRYKKRIKTSGIPIITYVFIAVIVRLILRPKKIARGRNKKTETPEDSKLDQS